MIEVLLELRPANRLLFRVVLVHLLGQKSRALIGLLQVAAQLVAFATGVLGGQPAR